MTSIILFSAVLLMIAGVNLYHISKAKLQIQNMADAAALVEASMEAKLVNVVVDRNEHLNHLYSNDYKPNSHSLPNISVRNKKIDTDSAAQGYANLVDTINKAQNMFIIAYNNFLGAGGNTASNGSGNQALGDVLSEIDGLQDPSILAVWVYNTDADKPTDQMVSSTGNLSMNVRDKVFANIHPLSFITEDVKVSVNKGKPVTLTSLAKSSNPIGYMRPDWKSNTLDVQVSKDGQRGPHWGAGVTIVKAVPLTFFGMTTIRADALAYVVNDAGRDVEKQSSDPSHPRPPLDGFRPTFYAELAYRK